jgi:two-component system capsular synthesis sensor histidine kinase RcsC
MNMIGNAIKFTPASGVVAIHLQLVRHERDYAATWDIKDSGIGMSAETIQKLGQAFEQADAGIQKKYGGTGLGLAMVKKLTDLLRGSLSIASELGKGSTFSVTIPMRPAAPQELSKHEMTDDTPIEVCGALIVDDTQTNRIVLNRMLSKLGFAPDEAENGPDALRIFRDKRPRVVFLDLQMPGMDGFEVIKNIRDIEATSPDQPKTFVIAVSGQAFDDDVEKCSKTGFDAHLPKPVSTRSLSAILRKRQASSTPAPERFRKN